MVMLWLWRWLLQLYYRCYKGVKKLLHKARQNIAMERINYDLRMYIAPRLGQQRVKEGGLHGSNGRPQ